jgi:hypothetical protein
VNLLADLHLRNLLADAAETIASEEISREVAERCSDCLDKACLAGLQQWLLQTLVLWAESVILAAAAAPRNAAESSDAQSPPPEPSWSQRLQRRLAHCFISCRTPQLFDMVKECVGAPPPLQNCNIQCRYPDSIPAIRDLADTLVCTDQYGVVVASLRQQLQRRLLHAAVSTGKIITVYISVLKVCSSSSRSSISSVSS